MALLELMQGTGDWIKKKQRWVLLVELVLQNRERWPVFVLLKIGRLSLVVRWGKQVQHQVGKDIPPSQLIIGS